MWKALRTAANWLLGTPTTVVTTEDLILAALKSSPIALSADAIRRKILADNGMHAPIGVTYCILEDLTRRGLVKSAGVHPKFSLKNRREMRHAED